MAVRASKASGNRETAKEELSARAEASFMTRHWLVSAGGGSKRRGAEDEVLFEP